MSQKNVNKFLAGAVTATMVATAVVTPAMAASFTDIGKLSPQVKGEVEKAVELGYFQDADKFNPAASITRGQVALTIARHVSGVAANDVAGLKAYVAEHGLESKVKGFVDVKKGETELYYASLIVKNAGAFTQDNLNAANNITRSQMAKVIATSFELSLDADNQKEITDIDRVTDKSFIKILASNGVTEPQNGKFNPGANVTRSQMASFLVRAHEVTQAVVDVNVTGVKVVNANTLELSGAGLKGLKASDLTLKDNEAASVNASADGKKATVTFKHNFPNKVEQTLTVKQAEQTKEFKFTYEFEAVKSVSLDEKTYDDNTKGQLLTFKVNGETTTTDSDFLRQQGFEVNFVAVDSEGKAADSFFKNSSDNTSKTGMLADIVKIDKYKVEIQLTKADKVVYSDIATITVTDLESSTESINALGFKNSKGFNMNSSTLVIDETADLVKIIANAAGKKDVSLFPKTAEVTSSNPAVISVNDQKLTANSVGTADITVTVGGVSKTVKFTVANQNRVVTKVTPTETTVKVVEDVTRNLKVVATDQFGDPIAVDGEKVEVDAPKVADNSEDNLVAAKQLKTNEAHGLDAAYTIKGEAVGNGTVLFKNKAGRVLGQIAVQVTDQVDSGTTKVEYTVNSDNQSNSIQNEDVNKYIVANYTKAGFYNGPVKNLTVKSANKKVATAEINSSTGEISVKGIAAGQTDIHITDENGQTVHKFTVTVNDSKNVITKVNFKDVPTITTAGSNITFSTALDIRPDNVVYGIDHNVATVAKTVIDQNGYISVDGEALGLVTLEVLTGSEKLEVENNQVTPTIGSKGQVLVRVTSATGDKITTIATKVINVDVK